jgi:hypothetical protein
LGDDSDLPEIITSNRQLPDLTTDAMKALERANDPPKLFRRSGTVVRVRRDEGPAYCEPLSVPAQSGESQGGGFTVKVECCITSSTSVMIRPDRAHPPGSSAHSRMLKPSSGHHPWTRQSRQSPRR